MVPATPVPLTRGCDVLVTGLPRAGTTLLVHLLGKLPDVVALDEPMDARTFAAARGAETIAAEVEDFVRAQRRSIVERGVAVSFNAQGKVPDNPVGASRDAAGLRQKVGSSKGEIAIGKPLPREFLLVVKHNASFTALLEPLARRFPVFAALRNPLSVLASWNSVSLPVGRGHVPAAEAIDARLAADLAAEPDVVARQIRILDWFCTHFRDHVDPARVLRYEDVVTSGGRALAAISPSAASLDEKLESRNRNELYDAKAMQEIGRRLLGTDGAFWRWYTRESVEALLRG